MNILINPILYVLTLFVFVFSILYKTIGFTFNLIGKPFGYIPVLFKCKVNNFFKRFVKTLRFYG